MQSTERKIAPQQRAVRKARIDVRLSPANKELLMQAAALRDTNLSDFILNSAQKEAEQIVTAHQIIALNERDSRAFAKALAEPPAPSERARQAARGYLAHYHE